jgi:outer membrane protein assembly factor BamE (lipoprotein component of BamABCDE complex)
MKAKFLALPLLSVACLAGGAASAATEDTVVASSSVYVGKVDPNAFPERALEHRKKGVTVSPAMVRMITPGIDKFSIYNLIGPPHFGEGITRRWNYVLFFPVAPGSTERVRCRMEIRFGPDRTDGYNIAVSEVVWKDQACADRVAAAS